MFGTVINMMNPGNYFHVQQGLVPEEIPKTEARKFNNIVFGVCLRHGSCGAAFTQLLMHCISLPAT